MQTIRTFAAGATAAQCPLDDHANGAPQLLLVGVVADPFFKG